jgi:predicted small lipoprotein YifL
MRALPLVLILLLAGCGQAGDLYLPPDPPAPQPSTAPAEAPPATPAPDPEEKKDKP